MFLEISQNSQEITCASLFFKKETLAQVFFCEFCEISKNNFFTEHRCWLLLRIRNTVKHLRRSVLQKQVTAQSIANVLPVRIFQESLIETFSAFASSEFKLNHLNSIFVSCSRLFKIMERLSPQDKNMLLSEKIAYIRIFNE